MNSTREENIYLLSLEKGVEKFEEGISLSEMKNYLDSKGYKINSTSYGRYPVWFFENFFVMGVDYDTNAGLREKILNNHPDSIAKIELFKGMLKGHAYFDYLAFLELKEARQSSKQAKNIAYLAIIISSVLALIQIIIGYFQITGKC